jgi:ABC-type microcin C transport system duplicated ATPase subunit YejF
VGAGVDLWFYEKKISTFIPIFANATVKFMDKKLAPFLFVNLGYAFKWQVQKKLEDNVFYGTKAGVYLQSGVGLHVTFSERLSLLFSAYYKMQQSAIQYRESDLLLAETKSQLFHSLGIKIGLLY